MLKTNSELMFSFGLFRGTVQDLYAKCADKEPTNFIENSFVISGVRVHIATDIYSVRNVAYVPLFLFVPSSLMEHMVKLMTDLGLTDSVTCHISSLNSIHFECKEVKTLYDTFKYVPQAYRRKYRLDANKVIEDARYSKLDFISDPSYWIPTSLQALLKDIEILGTYSVEETKHVGYDLRTGELIQNKVSGLGTHTFEFNLYKNGELLHILSGDSWVSCVSDQPHNTWNITTHSCAYGWTLTLIQDTNQHPDIYAELASMLNTLITLSDEDIVIKTASGKNVLSLSNNIHIC